MIAPRPPRLALAAALATASFALYLPVAGHRFLSFDDPQYLLENAMVRRGLTWAGAAWAFGTLHFSNWHPLTWLSHMLDVELFGLDAGAHHLVSAGLHAANAALLFLVLRGLTGATWRSLAVAALFAAHPLRVESVAWVAERKDLLSALFGLATLGAWRRHAERPGLARYLLAVAAFAASLMAKPMWVTLPFVLLLLDLWPLQRWAGSPLPADPECPSLPRLPLGALLLEKVPLLLLSAASSAITVIAQSRGGAVAGLEVGPGTRVANALLSCARYLSKSFWPADLAAFYPFPRALPAWQVGLAALLLAALTGLAVWRARTSPWLLVGWLWFLGTLVPVLGLVQVGGQAMADRYTYLPAIGLLVALAWELPRLAGARPAAVVAAAALLALGLATARQLAFWRDDVALFSHALAATGPENARARGLLAVGLLRAGRRAEARAEALVALHTEPGSARLWLTLGMACAELGQVREAREALRAALERDPRLAGAWLLLGRVERAGGDVAEVRRIAGRLEPLDPAGAAELRRGLPAP
ncbi:MAG: tetratricopeptide repeat protein [Deltaproteobacteria bacterium]|nr:tetratricopeptide repeat protein [Deltaproteobacteria bacterium]